MRSDVTIGMPFTEAKAALSKAGVAFKISEWHDGIGAGWRIEFSEDQLEYSLDFDPNYDLLDKMFALGADLPDLDTVLAIVHRIAARRGHPVEQRMLTTAIRRRASFEWQWDGCDCVTMSLDRTGEELWQVRIRNDGITGLRGPSHLSLVEARVRADEIRARLARAVAADGERGAAVARWAEVMGWRFQAVERFLAAVAQTFPDSPISIVTLGQLAEHARWLEQHESLFDQADDWRDALVVAAGDERHDHFEPPQLGWHVGYAREGAHSLRLVAGPFATGVHRVLRPVDELYPLRGDLPIEAVEIAVLPKEHSYKLRPDVVVATLDGVTAQIAGTGDDLEHIARLLVAARARRADRPT